MGDKVAFTYKDFPIHSRSGKAAESHALRRQTGEILELHDELYRSKELDLDQLKAQARALKLDFRRV